MILQSKLSKELEDNIKAQIEEHGELTEEFIEDFISRATGKSSKLSKEDRYEMSSLSEYFDLDNWKSHEAVLILCGIDPDGASIEYGYSNFLGAHIDGVRIKNVIFFGEEDSYDIPTKEDLFDLRDEYIRKIDGIRGELNDDFLTPSASEKRVKENKILKKEKLIKSLEHLMNDEHFNSVWDLRQKYSEHLSRMNKLWESGKHENKNSPDYYIKWAESKKLNISWLEWAIKKGYLSNSQDQKSLLQCANEISSKDLNMQKKRELVLSGWLLGKQYDEKTQIPITRKELWGVLSKANNKLFAARSDETINDFFQDQKLCSFKQGRPIK